MPRVFRYAGGLCAIAVALALTGGTNVAAALVPDGPRLAFMGLSTLDPQDFTVRVTGSELSRPLVLVRGSRPGLVPRPLSGLAWSADGSHVAFAARKGRREGIYVVRPDGTGLHFLRGTKGGTNPVFSHDGSKIAFARVEERNLLFSSAVWVANTNGSSPRRIVHGRAGFDYIPSSFSPDGSTLAVTRESGYSPPEPRAFLIRLKGKGGSRLLARWATEPVFSPDGSHVVFVRHSIAHPQGFKITHRDLYLMSTDDMTSTPLTRTHWISESQPSWDPSGQRIAFNSFRISKEPFEALFDNLLPFGNSIAQVNTDGSCRQKVLALRNAAIFGAAWQPGPGREAGRIAC